MKASAFIALWLLILGPYVHAEDKHLKPVVASASQADTSWNTNSWLWRDLVYGQNPSPDFRLGKSGFNISGPLVETLPRGKAAADRSLGRKILDFPLVHLFVPRPMPVEDSGGPYFAWRSSDQSWTTLAGGGAVPRPGIVSINW
jgi:hypothetical protein